MRNLGCEFKLNGIIYKSVPYNDRQLAILTAALFRCSGMNLFAQLGNLIDTSVLQKYSSLKEAIGDADYILSEIFPESGLSVGPLDMPDLTAVVTALIKTTDRSEVPEVESTEVDTKPVPEVPEAAKSVTIAGLEFNEDIIEVPSYLEMLSSFEPEQMIAVNYAAKVADVSPASVATFFWTFLNRSNIGDSFPDRFNAVKSLTNIDTVMQQRYYELIQAYLNVEPSERLIPIAA